MQEMSICARPRMCLTVPVLHVAPRWWLAKESYFPHLNSAVCWHVYRNVIV